MHRAAARFPFVAIFVATAAVLTVAPSCKTRNDELALIDIETPAEWNFVANPPFGYGPRLDVSQELQKVDRFVCYEYEKGFSSSVPFWFCADSRGFGLYEEPTRYGPPRSFRVRSGELDVLIKRLISLVGDAGSVRGRGCGAVDVDRYRLMLRSNGRDYGAAGCAGDQAEIEVVVRDFLTGTLGAVNEASRSAESVPIAIELAPFTGLESALSAPRVWVRFSVESVYAQQESWDQRCSPWRPSLENLGGMQLLTLSAERGRGRASIVVDAWDTRELHFRYSDGRISGPWCHSDEVPGTTRLRNGFVDAGHLFIYSSKRDCEREPTRHPPFPCPTDPKATVGSAWKSIFLPPE